MQKQTDHIGDTNKMVTAVEFLLTELDIAKLIAREKLTMAAEIVRQAKQMEERQISKAHYDGYYREDLYDTRQYYNDTYGK